MAVTLSNSDSLSIHKKMYDSIVNTSNAIALSQLWVCEIPRASLETIINYIDDHLNEYTDGTFEKINGNYKFDEQWMRADFGDVYLLTSGIRFLGDSISIERIGVSNAGAVKGLITNGRADFENANITFIETNASFVDSILRPWAVLAGFRSLKDSNLKMDIKLHALRKPAGKTESALTIRKTLTLKQATPVIIDSDEYNYTGDTIIQRQVQFAFNDYKMSNDIRSITIEKQGPINIDVKEDNYKQASVDDAKTAERIINSKDNEVYDIFTLNEEESATIIRESEVTEVNTPYRDNKMIVVRDYDYLGLSMDDEDQIKQEAAVKPYTAPYTVPEYKMKVIGDYDTEPINQLKEPPSLLGQAQSLINTAAGAVNKVQSISNSLTTGTARLLNSVGNPQDASAVMRLDNNTREFMKPATDILSTGGGILAAADSLKANILDITGNDTIVADEKYVAVIQANLGY